MHAIFHARVVFICLKGSVKGWLRFLLSLAPQCNSLVTFAVYPINTAGILMLPLMISPFSTRLVTYIVSMKISLIVFQTFLLSARL